MQKPAIFDLLDAAGQSGKNRPQALSPLLPVPGTPPTPNSPGNVRSPTAAAQILYTITPERRKLVQLILDGDLGILPELDRVRVQTLFETLDTNCDRRIAVDDFEHHFPSVRKTLMEVWNFLVEQFDFNHDGVIEPHEFLGHFVIYALYFMKAEPCTAANSGDQLVQWEETFLRNFRRRLVEIESLVRESGQRT